MGRTLAALRGCRGANLLGPGRASRSTGFVSLGQLALSFDRFLALVEAGPDADIESFIDEHMAPSPNVARRVEAVDRLISDFAGARGGRIVDQTEGRIVAVFTTAGGEELLGVEIQSEAPHRILGVIRGRT